MWAKVATSETNGQWQEWFSDVIAARSDGQSGESCTPTHFGTSLVDEVLRRDLDAGGRFVVNISPGVWVLPPTSMVRWYTSPPARRR